MRIHTGIDFACTWNFSQTSPSQVSIHYSIHLYLITISCLPDVCVCAVNNNEYSDDDAAFSEDFDANPDDDELMELQDQEARSQEAQSQEADALGGSSGAGGDASPAVEIPDPMSEYPEPEQRAIPLDVLLAKANYIREAAAMHRGEFDWLGWVSVCETADTSSTQVSVVSQSPNRLGCRHQYTGRHLAKSLVRVVLTFWSVQLGSGVKRTFNWSGL